MYHGRGLNSTNLKVSVLDLLYVINYMSQTNLYALSYCCALCNHALSQRQTKRLQDYQQIHTEWKTTAFHP